MKCCGNCCGFPTIDLDPCEHYKFGGNGSSGKYCCYRWTFDDKTKEDCKWTGLSATGFSDRWWIPLDTI